MKRNSKILERLKLNARVALWGHVLNPFWKSSLERRRTRGEATSKAVLKYLTNTLSSPLNIPEQKKESQSNPSLTDMNVMFSIWLQGIDNAPDIVKSCLNSQLRHFDGHCVSLTIDDIKKWITLPEFIIEKWNSGKIKAAHFVDICRVELLYQYGGVWMDATNYMIGKIPSKLLNSDFFVYGSGNEATGSYALIQNCFIIAKAHNRLLEKWRELIYRYWSQENSAADYFIHQMLFKYLTLTDPEAKSLFDAMPKIDQDKTHVVWYKMKDAPYDPTIIETLAKDVVFQKCDYKSEASRNPVKGSFAEYIVKNKENQ